MGEFHIFYSITSLFIRVYKWIELCMIRMFRSQLERRIRSAYRNLDVKFSGSGVTEITQQQKRKTSSNNNHEQKKFKWDNARNCDMEVHNNMFFSRIINHASMGMGETYMDKYWDCNDIDELSYRIFKSGIFLEYLNNWNRFLNYMELCFFNLQNRERAWEVGKKHYDTGTFKVYANDSCIHKKCFPIFLE